MNITRSPVDSSRIQAQNYGGSKKFTNHPTSDSGSPERSPLPYTIRRSQSATMTTTGVNAFRDLTIRPIPLDNYQEVSNHNTPVTPPKTPNQRPVQGFEHITETFEGSHHDNPNYIREVDEVQSIPEIPAVHAELRGRREFSKSPSTLNNQQSPSVHSPVRDTSTSHSDDGYNYGKRMASFKNRHQAYMNQSPEFMMTPPKSAPAPPIPTSTPTTHYTTSAPSITPNFSRNSAQKTSRSSRQKQLQTQTSQKNLNGNEWEGGASTSQSLEAAQILGLMKELRGRMEGSLEYRIGESTTWVKGYCTINQDTGHLIHIREDRAQQTVVGDLRGCQVRTNTSPGEDMDNSIEIYTHSSRHQVRVRPATQEQYNKWLAAFLCWQPIRPAGPNNKMIKQQSVKLSTERKADRRRSSDASGTRDAAIIKVGKMMLWDRTGSGAGLSGSSTKHNRSHRNSIVPGWKKISCILQENGEFKLYNESDVALLSVVQLSQLSRCAIQHLDETVLNMDYCIAIYPQYTPSSSFSTFYPQNPICLAVETRLLYEVWFVLLRAYTIPELYGPAGTTSQISSPASHVPLRKETSLNSLEDTFRVPRSLNVRITEAKLTSIAINSLDHHGHEKNMEVYIEVLIDGEVRARTMPRLRSTNIFWSEEFEFHELPAQLENIEFVLMQRTLTRKHSKGSHSNNGSIGGGGISCEVLGRLDVKFKDMTFDQEMETWWPLVMYRGTEEHVIGEIMLKLRKEELVVLMSDEYKPIVGLLSDFSNNLTMDIGAIVSTDIRRLSHTLLKILQVNGKASEWLITLAEAEIDGTHKESPLAASGRYNQRQNSNDSSNSQFQADREIARRDASKLAITEANLLFRGNTLLTKALEAHMTRFGHEYLEETIGGNVCKIVEEDYYCEVDPARLRKDDDLKHQWKILVLLTKGVWQAIYTSAARCPLEIRKVLLHIRSCVEDIYGDVLKTVSYSCVSGFLFLRFFCPGVLNPKLFGLVKDQPRSQAQRTLTLITKSLQGLANMTTFGTKEPWMEPMNEFLQQSQNEFKDYIDQVCTITSAMHLNNLTPPSYATPTTILARLPPASKEGFPSLPFLIDQPRAVSRLVTMWLKWYEIQSNRANLRLKGDLLTFHELCMHIKDRMALCVERAENAGRPSSGLSARWEEVAESVAGSPLFQPGHYHAIAASSSSQHSGSTKQSGTTRTVRNGSTASVVEEEEHDYLIAGVAASGKNKLTELVVGLKRRVRKGIDE